MKLEKLCFDNIMSVYKQLCADMLQSEALTLDLAKVEQYDSSAIALLLAIKRFAKTNNKSFEMVNVPEELIELAKISRIKIVRGQTPD